MRATLTFVLAAVCVPMAAGEQKPKGPAEIARKGKAATALVEVRTGGRAKGVGTAFCVDASGLFITNEHLLRSRGRPGGPDAVALVLRTNEADERRVAAEVVRVDKALDLALLQVTKPAGRFAHLPLAAVEAPVETAEVLAVGYSFGRSATANRASQPSISVSMGRVTSLRKRRGVLERILLDAALGPGNSGGPVLDGRGRVIGVVVSGAAARSASSAIPVREVMRFFRTPRVEFTPPRVTRKTMHQPVEFAVRLTSFGSSRPAYSVTLKLTGRDGQRSWPLAPAGQTYRVKAVPFVLRKGPARLGLIARFPGGGLTGRVADRQIGVGGKKVKLADVQLIRGGEQGPVVLRTGKVLRGKITGLSAVEADLGTAAVEVDLGKASMVEVRPPGEETTVAYSLAIRVGESLLKEIRGRLAVEPAAAAGAGPGAKAPAGWPGIRKAPVTKTKDVPVPSTIADVVAGGGGRFLILYLKDLRQLAVFDVNAAGIVKFLPIGGSDAVLAAGATKLIVVLRGENVIQRWDLTTFQKELVATPPFKGHVRAIAMGSNSPGPALVLWATERDGSSGGSWDLLDPVTMRARKLQATGRGRAVSHRHNVHVRASANGTVFGLWCSGVSPTGLETLVLRGDRAECHREHTSAGEVLPGPDGHVLFTRAGLYTKELVALYPELRKTGQQLVPAHEGNYFVGISPSSYSSRRSKSAGVTVYILGDTRALVKVPPVETPTGGRSGSRSYLTTDKRYHFIPSAELLVVVPPTRDRLVLRHLNVLEELKRSDVDYLFVSSSPLLAARRGQPYEYAIRVESRRGGVGFSLASGPEGMAVSPSGKITWQPSGTHKAATASVIVLIKDASGQEIYHTFTISVTD